MDVHLSFVDPAGLLTKEVLTDVLVRDFPHSRTDTGTRISVPADRVRRKVVVQAAPVSQPGVRTFLVWMKTLPLESERGAETSIDTKDPASSAASSGSGSAATRSRPRWPSSPA